MPSDEHQRQTDQEEASWGKPFDDEAYDASNGLASQFLSLGLFLSALVATGNARDAALFGAGFFLLYGSAFYVGFGPDIVGWKDASDE